MKNLMEVVEDIKKINVEKEEFENEVITAFEDYGNIENKEDENVEVIVEKETSEQMDFHYYAYVTGASVGQVYMVVEETEDSIRVVKAWATKAEVE